jgi:hypothetical protein
MKTEEKNLTSEIYDYIALVTIRQNKLIDIKILYGDGSRWKGNFNLFEQVYKEIEKLLNA